MAKKQTFIQRTIGTLAHAAGMRVMRREEPLSVEYVGASSHREVRTADQLMAIAAASRCVQIISEMIASLPVQVLCKKGDITMPDTTPDSLALTDVLNCAPNVRMTSFDLMVAAISQLVIDGNAYILPVRDTRGELQSLQVFDRYAVSHNEYTGLYDVNDPRGIYSGVYTPLDIIHLKNRTVNGLSGVGVLTSARMTAGIIATADAETHDRLAGGGNDRCFLSIDANLAGIAETQNPDEMDVTARRLEAQKRAGRHFLAIDSDIKVTPTSFSSADLEFLASRKFEVEEICRFFGVPPVFVYSGAGGNYKSVEMDNVAFLSHTLGPLLTRIEQEFNRKLLRPNEVGRRFIRYDREALYACDLAGQLSVQEKRIATGIDTPNEARRRANRPAVEGGDTVMLSANLKPINQFTTENG